MRAIDSSAPVRGNLPQCESVRGIAILLVFCFHYLGLIKGYSPFPDMPEGLGLLFGGNTGVTLFFVLSGFLLTRPFVSGAQLNWLSFYQRRALRILPMYYLCVLLGALLNQPGSWLSAFKALFFFDIGLSTLWPMGAVWWSLVVEIQFYLLLPLLILLARSARWRYVLWLALAAGIYSYWRVQSAGIDDSLWGRGRDSILGRWPCFMVGFGLAWLEQRKREHKYRSAASGFFGLLLIMLSLLGLTLLCNIKIRTLGMFAHVFWFEHYLYEALCWGVFIFAILNYKFPGYALIVNPLLHHLGLWSYSFYLLHSAVLFALLNKNPYFSATDLSFSEPGKVILVGLLVFLFTAVLACLTYQCIERPFLGMKPKKISSETPVLESR
jgi:peptidoglycan/LPS O-acetylase OafA/YrhL